MLHLVNRLTLFSLIGLLVVAPSREDFGYASDPFRQTTQERRGAGSGAGGENDVRALEPGKPHRRVLADGQRHTYRIRLAADQFLKAVIEQDGIDVVARLLGPDGKQIMEFDSERRLRGRETVAQVAEGEGDYRLVVQPRQKAAQAGAYEIQIEELRAATDADRALQEARKLYKKAIDLRNAGKYDEALSPFERALEIRERRLGPDHPDVSQAINSLATLHYYKGDYAKAEPLYQRALAIREKALGPEHPDVGISLNYLAILYAAKGAIAQAITFQSRANAVSERNLTLNLATGSERQKLAYLALFSRETDFTLSLLSQALPHDPQALDLAFTTLLRRKGRGLDVMANTISALRRRAAPEDQALFDQLAEARSQLAALTLKGLGTDKSETYRARLKSLEDKGEELESALSARRPEFRAQPVTLAAVQAALPAGGALVEFAAYTPQDPRNDKNKLPPRYLAYLLAAKGQPRWIDLGEAAPIDRAITSWRQALRDPRRTDVKRLARAVDEKVMRPVLSLAQPELGEFRRLLIAPDGMLNLIPFAALVDRQGSYLVERYSISYLMSGRDLLRSPVRWPSEQDAVIVAGPDYGARGDAVVASRQDVRPPKSAGSNFNLAQIYFPPLKGAADEAWALKAILPQATVLTGEQATEAALKQLHSPSILHVATHGFFLRDQEIRLVGARDIGAAIVRSGAFPDRPVENPLLRSGLALAGVNQRLGRADQGDDGVLTALEATGLDLF